jgi:predicted DNA-binding ribbon-helix-helix protein
MKSTIKNRSIVLKGVQTSIALEDAFWHELRRLADIRSQSPSKLIAEIQSLCGSVPLSSAVRVFILQHARQRPPLPTPEQSSFFLPP